jgi:hypothetical protein
MDPDDDPRLSDSVRLATLEFVWRKVYETYWDTAFGGVDWRAIRDRYRPFELSTPESRAFHDLLGRITRELHISLLRVVGPESALNVQSTAADVARLRYAHHCVDLRFVVDKLLVTRVDSPYPHIRQARGQDSFHDDQWKGR